MNSFTPLLTRTGDLPVDVMDPHRRRDFCQVEEDDGRLTLINPANFQYTGSGSVLPLTFGGRRKWIYVPATAKVRGAQPETLQFFVDTGSSDAVDTILLKKSKERLRRTQTGQGLAF